HDRSIAALPGEQIGAASGANIWTGSIDGAGRVGPVADVDEAVAVQLKPIRRGAAAGSKIPVAPGLEARPDVVDGILLSERVAQIGIEDEDAFEDGSSGGGDGVARSGGIDAAEEVWRGGVFVDRDPCNPVELH